MTKKMVHSSSFETVFILKQTVRLLRRKWYVIFSLFQALPLVTVFVGRKTDKDVCRILTLAPGVDNPTYVEFAAPSPDNPPPVGTPKWANYVKGVIAHFKGNIIT